MNEIEKKFFDAWNDYSVEGENEEDSFQYYTNKKIPVPTFILEQQIPIGVYRADFLLGNRLIIEIDGQETHKTKEQRYADHKRDRFLTLQGFIVIHFTASEVFLDARSCVINATEIANAIEDAEILNYNLGWKSCINNREKELNAL